MTTMIEDAVNQVKAGIDQKEAAQRRLYTTGEFVVVRTTSWSRGSERRTWSNGVVVGAVCNGRSWVYRIRITDSRGYRTYVIAGRGSLRKA